MVSRMPDLPVQVRELEEKSSGIWDLMNRGKE